MWRRGNAVGAHESLAGFGHESARCLRQRIDLGLWGDDRADGVWDVTIVEVEELLSEKTAEVQSKKR